jgi:deoxyribodipyrimidine photo-lyase
MPDAPLVYWFRQDLRLSDLPGLHAALATGKPLVLCYILDDIAPGEWAMGGASRWWLHHSLAALQQAIADRAGQLILRRGGAGSQLLQVIEETGADTVYCSRCYEPWAVLQESALHEALGRRDISFKRFPGSLLFEPGSILSGSGLPYKVFTPFWRACLREPEPPAPREPPPKLDRCVNGVSTVLLEDLRLLPQGINWARGWSQLWSPGEAGAREKLALFLTGAVENYRDGRNHPARNTTSRLSAHLHFGEISPRLVWHQARAAGLHNPPLAEQVDKFLSEMGWREFSHHLLVHWPTLPERPFKEQFSQFPWLGNREHLAAWQQGQTGYPIVDAGMRELWQTGSMHNRVRMIVASFLTKHLLLPWRLGEDWFWDTLVDADLANNASGWQWVAGSGADASPYFRIFNPTLQGEKFDAEGDYVRRWVPELAALPNKYLHKPHLAPASILESSGITLGADYPQPIVDHALARKAALDAYSAIKNV